MRFDVDITIVVLYLIATLAIGIWKGRGVKNLKEYAVGDRKFSIMILVSTIFSTWVGGGSTVGTIEKVSLLGFAACYIFYGNTIKKIILIKFILPRLPENKNYISFGELLDESYGKVGRVTAGFAALVMSIGDIGAQVAAMGYLLQFFTGISFACGVFIATGIVVIYSSFGGIKSVAVTDLFQFSNLIISIPMVLNIALQEVGGYNSLFINVPASKLNFIPDKNIIFSFLPVFIYLCFPFESPAMAQRLFMSSSKSNLKKAMRISLLLDIPFVLIVGFIGLVGTLLYSDQDGNHILFKLINDILPIGLKGFVIAGIISVTMSSADSFLNSASIAFVNDFIIPLSTKKISNKTQLYFAKIVTFSLGLFSIVSAIYFKSIIDIFSSFFSIWSATVLVPLTFCIFGIKIKAKEFVFNAIIGLVTVAVWNSYFENIYGINSILPSLLVNLLFFLFFFFKNIDLIESKPIFRFSLHFGKSLKAADTKALFLSILKGKNTKSISYYQYKTFAIFGLIAYATPFFLWEQLDFKQNMLLIFLRFMSALGCFLLLIYDLWPKNLKKFVNIYWLFLLTLSIPFIFTLNLLVSGMSTIWLINLSLSLFLLSSLVDWKNFIGILLFGVLSAIYLFDFIYGFSDSSFEITISEKIMLSYISIFSAIIGLTFSRNREFIQQKILQAKENLNQQLESKVQERTNDLSEALSIKKRFLNNISHEIRTPLQGIVGISNGLQDSWDKLEEHERKSLLGKIVSNNDRLMNLLSNILDVSKFENGKINFSIKAGNIVKTIEEVVAEFDISLNEFKITFRNEIGNKIIVKFDKERISQVVRNLLTNAVKYGNGSDIDISIIQEDKFVMVSIIDGGIGISSDELDIIFKPFTESRRTSSMSGGTGLGLAICKEIVEAHGGKIKAESKDTKTIFSFTLPIYFLSSN